MKNYLTGLKHVIDNGITRGDRTGVGTISTFAMQMRMNLQEGFPLLTTKKLHTRSIFHELLWFLKGDSNIRYLKENGVSIWDEWADEAGNLGPVYGSQWRNWNNQGIDQIKKVIAGIKSNPNSRRHIVSAWNPSQIDNMALPPCHVLFQFYVADEKLSCMLYQRSCDYFLGVPFNIASYALLTHMVAQVCNLTPHEFIWTGGDVHLYLNHLEQAKLQLIRTPQSLPKLLLNPDIDDVFDFTYKDIGITDYNPQPHISAPIAV